jgi:23S rRNA (guanosine2251-2'-O)-methyltransferase
MRIYGRRPVLEALQAGTVSEIWLARGVQGGLYREVASSGVPIRWVSRIELDTLFGTTKHQGVLAEVTERPPTASPLERAAAAGEWPLLLLLDGITDPHNLGAILRSAEALGAHGVITEEHRSAPLSPAAVKAAAGATAHLSLLRVKNLPSYIRTLQQQGVWVYGAAGEADLPVSQLDFCRPVAIAIGSEGQGLRRLVRERCDALAAIPLRGQVRSLNASVAAALMVYSCQEQRRSQ